MDKDPSLVDTAEGQIDSGTFQGREGLALYVEGGRVDNGGHASGEEHACQGHNKGLDLQISHQETLDQAVGQADAQGQHHGSRKAPALAVDQDRAAHADQGSHAADGNIDAAGDHDKAHAAAHDDQGRVLIEDVAEGLGL